MLEIWARGSGVYFGACSGKEKWSAPLCRHCMRTVATLQRLDYPNQRDVFILVLGVTVMYTVQAEERDWAEQTRVLSYNCQSLSNFPDPLLKARHIHTLQRFDS